MSTNVAIVPGPDLETGFKPRFLRQELIDAIREGGYQAHFAEALSQDLSGLALVVVDVCAANATEQLARAKELAVPAILSTVLRPKGPWHLNLEMSERSALIPAWERDFEERSRTALSLIADAYVDSPGALAAAVSELLGSSDTTQSHPSLCYRGALFNDLPNIAIGDVFALPVGKDAILGRGKGVAVLTHSPQIARHHLRLHLEPDGSVEVLDLGGTNPNWLCRASQEPLLLEPGQRIHIVHGDELAIAGEFRMRYVRG